MEPTLGVQDSIGARPSSTNQQPATRAAGDSVPLNPYDPPPSDLALNWEDLKMVAEVERTRRDSLLLRDWWDAHRGDYPETVRIAGDGQYGEQAFGFFDTVPFNGAALPVFGVVQEMFFDRPKRARIEDVCAEFREFVLGYFMRVSHLEEPPGLVEDTSELPVWLKPLSWRPERSDSHIGFGYEQLVTKRRDDGRFVKFDRSDRGAIVDLRSIGPVYDWLTMRVKLFDFKLTTTPFGPNGPAFAVPLKEITYLLVTPELIIDRDRPAPNVLGEFGFGYGLLPYTPEQTIFAYGPGKFEAGFQSFVFQVLETGEIRAKAVFVVNRPDKILSVDLDPIEWGFKIADLMTFNLASLTLAPMKNLAKQLPLRVLDVDPISLYISTVNGISGGLAGRQLGHTKLQLEKHMMQRHFIQHRQMLMTSQRIWRMISDWTNRSGLPEFCHRGLSSE